MCFKTKDQKVPLDPKDNNIHEHYYVYTKLELAECG